MRIEGVARMGRNPLAWLAVALLLGSLPLYGKKKRQPAAPPDLPTRVNDLVLQLYGVPLDESAALASQVQTLVLGHLTEWLHAHPPGAEPVESPVDIPYDVKVRRQMEYAFSKLHYPLVGAPVAFAKPWKGETLIGAAYMLGWRDQDRTNLVALYEARGGEVREVQVSTFVPGADVHFAFPAPPASSSFDFLVYGTRLGKSHPRLSAILFAFDGRSFRPVWKSVDDYDGKLDVDGDQIVIRYLKEQEFIQATEAGEIPPRYEAVYKVTSQGVELLSRHTIPYR